MKVYTNLRVPFEANFSCIICGKAHAFDKHYYFGMQWGSGEASGWGGTEGPDATSTNEI